MAAKTNKSFSNIDKSVFFFAQKCGKCHPGGGGLEYDRDGYRYFDNVTGKFGYELSGRDPKLDGDYTSFSAGNPKFGAPWNKSGVLEADCLICHLKGYNWKARMTALNGRKFLWAPAIGAGWADVVMGKEKKGNSMVKAIIINYTKSSIADFNNLGNQITKTVPAKNCWSCHRKSDTGKRGRSIAIGKDIHLKKMGSCVICHPSDKQHNFAKGDAGVSTVRDDLDNTMKTCNDCHLGKGSKNAPYPARHNFPKQHYKKIGCEACHIPYKDDAAVVVLDNASTGKTIGLPTAVFYKFDKEKPRRWMPALKLRHGKIKPFKELIAIWWGNLNEKSSVIAPIPLWKIRDMKKPKLNDDNKDGKPEVNTIGEIKEFLLTLKKAKDKFGNRIAENPALVKGGRVYKLTGKSVTYYKDDQAEADNFSISHNVLDASVAIGSKGCKECHSKNSSFFFRKVLVDPYDENGKPVYEPTWKLMGYTKEQVKRFTSLKVPK